MHMVGGAASAHQGWGAAALGGVLMDKDRVTKKRRSKSAVTVTYCSRDKCEIQRQAVNFVVAGA